ncbi:Lrp/AsnC ligand binding domain-containing protein [Natrononativus amylolyticus]|uniref:Lrp/AsnC ligand binding domain-containing protein n=1 Tax=Natrononativus amylolyticus TaxID=2963434 RepID=UPI0020CE9C3E|nr:Lrp/AsnC ligand binding domain-containing protein [Natrononativus amylolyticus]
MVRAFTLVTCAAGTSGDACAGLRDVDAVREAHVVAGEFDVVAELEAPTVHALLQTVTGEIRSREDVGTTRTYVCQDS